ncbi:MAG: AAA family ATPase, partial [Chloroflexi bacterium]|nr:AAA family ATPase [Chloroflexota bacterium]
FCDVKGSTALAEQLGPEEWAEIMGRAFQHLIAPVYRYEGTVARLMGDAILAFFGAPIAHEDDPQRATLAALGIVEGVQGFRAQMTQERGLDFNVRVGINTGLVVVGEVGSDLRMEYTAMGDAVNLASRMEQAAQPGTVQITANTYKFIAPLFDCEPLGNVEIKGKEERVPAYRLLGAKAQPRRLRGIEGLDAPLVGRADELGVLRQAAAGVVQGDGKIICLMGEAGLGKSRLIGELRSAPEGLPVAWTMSQCVSYDAARPYSLVQQHLQQTCGLTPADPPALIREKIARVLHAAPEEWRYRAIHIFELLLTGENPSAGVELAGEALKRELFEVMLQAQRMLTAGRPSVLVFDDLHWCDTASLELLLHLIQLVDEQPILFLCIFRPDRQSPAWQIKQTAETRYPHCYTEILLNPLSAADSNRLIDSLLTVADLAPALRERVLAKTEGNPFFVEEVVRTLIDSGAVVRDEARNQWRAAAQVGDITIPDNLQGLLTARIDRLEEDARYTLQMASVVGRSFYYRVLRRIAELDDAVAPASGSPPSLDRHLRTLQRVDLIREAARVPELEYSFRHALTQEAAYKSILLRRRREFHRRVAETLEALFADRLAEQTALLAHHFYEAGDSRAMKYLTMAGDSATRLYANTEAVALFGRALEVIRREPSPDHQTLLHLFIQRGRALELNGQHQQALDNYAEMDAMAKARGDRPLELAALMLRATLYATPTAVHDSTRGEALSKQSLALAQELGDRKAESKILWNLMINEAFTGGWRLGIQHGTRSLAIARELNLREQMAFTLNDLFYTYVAAGQLANAERTIREAHDLWRELGNKPMLVDNRVEASYLSTVQGQFDEALAIASDAYQIARSIGNGWGQAGSQLMLGKVYLERGQLDQAISAYAESYRLGDQSGNIGAQVSARCDLAWLYALAGVPERGLALTKPLMDIADKNRQVLKPLAVGALARVLIHQGDLTGAENLLSTITLSLDFVTVLFSQIVFMLAEGDLAVAQKDYARATHKMDELTVFIRNASFRLYLAEAL